VETAEVGMDGGTERKRDRNGRKEPRLRRWYWRKPLIQIVRSAGPTSEAVLLLESEY